MQSPSRSGPIPTSPATPFTLSAILRSFALAGVRLPLATALGAVGPAETPRDPVRQPAVVQTQIVLAIVGAVIMLIVGASLARAFGIVGVASLIRYRSKIDDPKDAVVMLAALAVGLASGVGLFPLAIFATLFLFAALYVIEGFEPQMRQFELKVKLGSKTPDLRGRVETILRRYRIDAELRGTSEDEVVYFATVPLTFDTERVSSALVALAQDGKGAVEWNEKPKAKQK